MAVPRLDRGGDGEHFVGRIMNAGPTHAREIFLEALERPTADRYHFIAIACAGECDLQREVHGLLAAFARAESELEPVSVPVADCQERNGLVGTRIGSFQLARLIASGGMGVVYEAEQDHPRRIVALKVMKRGLVSRSALRRFEYEAQILARLRHPNIAQIYEAGTHDDGSGSVPWFAMEYVPNAEVLTAFASARSLDVRARLELFIKVCDAVHHGHQKGVIHRDLKPANILVDSAGEPKIIDFGVARTTDSDLAVTTMQTETGQLVGTVQYMSPEQCAADPHDLDTRTDVYSLGVVLFELLSGQCPYDVAHTPIIQATRIISESSPARLSSIDRALRGDIETIVLKALEKDRDRRFQSAADLAKDVQRFLRREPIVARPASISYQLKMFARRQRAVVFALSALFAVLVAGIIITTIFWAQARTARDENRQLAEHSFEFFREQLGVAVRAADRAGNADVAKEFIDAFAQGVAARLGEQPELEARFRGELAQGYRFISYFKEAEAQTATALDIARRELGEAHPITIQMMIWLAEIYRDLTRHEQAEEMYRAVIDLERRARPRAEWFLGSWSNFADMLHDIGRLEDAENLYEGILDVLPVYIDQGGNPLYHMRQLAGVYRDQGRYSEAESLLLDLLRQCEHAWPQGDPSTSDMQRELGRLYLAQGRLDEAALWQQRAIEGYRDALDHRDDNGPALMALELGALIHLERGHLEEAERTFADAAQRADQFLRSEQQWWAANFRTGQGICLLRMGRHEEAEAMLSNAYSILHERLGDIHHRTQNSIRAMIDLCVATGRPDEATSWRGKLRERE